MNFDFSTYPLHTGGYSRRPMTLLNPEPEAMLSAVTEIALMETGNRSAREQWQQTQLCNLIKHAVQRSAFWRTRIGDSRLSDIELASLPILTRQDLRQQVDSEGPLLRAADGIPTKAHTTSGSSGIPVRFFISDFNSRYNVIRSIAQSFMEGRDLSLNRTRVRQADAPVKNGISVERQPSWIGPLSSLITVGANKHIEFIALYDTTLCRKLIDELRRDSIGYLVCNPRLIDTLGSTFDLDFLRETKTAMWISLGESVGPHLIEAFARLAIPIRQNYSSEEVGMIGVECMKVPGHYHVATSNVMVEIVDRRHVVGGIKLGKVLVTHLHSYATPLIRYDLGDLACLLERCPCGHDGATIHYLQGRASSVIKHRDGRLSPFLIRGKDLAALAEFTEYRIRQTGFDKIVIEIGGRSKLSTDEVSAIKAFLEQRAGQEFEIEVRACEEIDWGQSRKRLGFRCEL